MKERKDNLSIVVMALAVITTVAGMLSMNFTKAYDFVNQYGHTVKMFGYGIYARDTYFQAPISIGSDICIFFMVIPMLYMAHKDYVKRGNVISQLKLISVYGVVVYYAASIAFGLTYNRLFLVYVALFATSLFGMFRLICQLKLTQTFAPTKGLGIFLVLSGIALIVAWLPDIIPSMINGGTISLIGVYHTCITYVLDMGVISPLCFVTLFLLKKGDPLGTLLLAIMLKACIVIGVMMFPQMICQILSGCDMPLGALVTKSFSFIALGAFASYFNKKLYASLSH